MGEKRTKWDSISGIAALINVFSLTCFAPGNFLLGGRALNREDIFQFGLDVLEGCWHTYKVTPNGISPERTLFPGKTVFLTRGWSWQSNDTVDKPYGHRSYTEWENYGIWTVDGEYYLRPGPNPAIYKLI